jgi:hypothetical protein
LRASLWAKQCIRARGDGRAKMYGISVECQLPPRSYNLQPLKT